MEQLLQSQGVQHAISNPVQTIIFSIIGIMCVALFASYEYHKQYSK